MISAAKMRALEGVWLRTTIPDRIVISNKLMGMSRGFKYSFALNDGYAESGDAYLGIVAGNAYLDVILEGDGGGFKADTYSSLVSLGSVVSAQRQSEMKEQLRVPEFLRNPEEKDEKSGANHPPTRSESNSDDHDKPQSEPEERPQ